MRRDGRRNAERQCRAIRSSAPRPLRRRSRPRPPGRAERRLGPAHRPVGQRQGSRRPRHPRRRAARAGKPFVAVNCGAIPATCWNPNCSAMRRAPSPAPMPSIKGRFEEADGGTLFLDEIGDMPADMQVKLLRVLEERAVQRVGGRGQIAVDVRIVAATHRDIDAAIDAGALPRGSVLPPRRLPDRHPGARRAGRGRAPARRAISSPARRAGAARRPSRPTPMRGWPSMAGRAMSASCAISSSAPTIMFAGRTIGADEAGALLLRRGRVGAVETRALWAATEASPIRASSRPRRGRRADPRRQPRPRRRRR